MTVPATPGTSLRPEAPSGEHQMLSWVGGWSAGFVWLAAKMNARIENAENQLATTSWPQCRSTADASHHRIATIPRRPPAKRGAAGFHHDLNDHRHQRITPAS